MADKAPLPLDGADGRRDEAFRVLRENLLGALSGERSPVVVVTSPGEGEGKTSVVAGLAAALARGGRRVVAVDFDLRRPCLHRWFRTEAAPGATEVLTGAARLADCLRYVRAEPGAPGLYLLPGGSPPEDPAGLLGGARARAVVGVLAAQADLVLVDTAPVLSVADTLALAPAATGVALVVQARRTTIPSALQAKAALVRHRARLLGVVIHRADPRDAALDASVRYDLGRAAEPVPAGPGASQDTRTGPPPGGPNGPVAQKGASEPPSAEPLADRLAKRPAGAFRGRPATSRRSR